MITLFKLFFNIFTFVLTLGAGVLLINWMKNFQF